MIAAGILPDPQDALEILPGHVAGWIALLEQERPLLLDCREADELNICRIAGNMWIPLHNIPSALETLRNHAGRGIVIYCHHGMRSLDAARFLRARGIASAFSMSGGIDLWSRQIDPEIPRY